jgi:hypothetical protein
MKKIEESLITEDIKAMIGVEIGPAVYEISRGLLEKFADITDNIPLIKTRKMPLIEDQYSDMVVPLTLLISLFRLGQDEWARTVNCPLRGVIAGGSLLENYKTVMAGDSIVVTGKLMDAYERDGRAGKLVFLVFERNYKNEKNELLARMQQTFIRI